MEGDMDFLGGLIAGVVIGGTGCAIFLGALMTAKRADRDYESEQNEPNAARVDRQKR
jgi:hypothetical protein